MPEHNALPEKENPEPAVGGVDWGSRVTVLGTTALKEKTVNFGIKDADRLRHLCVLGRAGSGRTELLVRVALQDVERGIGTVFLDASGTAAPALIERIPEAKKEDIIYLDPSDAEYPYSWNPLDDITLLPSATRFGHLASLLASLYHIEHSDFVEYAARLMLERDDATLITFHLLVSDEKAREKFFEKDVEGKKAFEEKLKAEPDIAKALEVEGRYVARDTLVRNLLGQRTSKFSLTEAMKAGKIVIVDFSHIRVFPTRMSPLVRTFVAVAAFAAENGYRPVSLILADSLRYLDEADIERAFSAKNLAIALADSAREEGNHPRRELAASRCGSIASFAAGASDRSIIERAFYPYADAEELVQLESGEMIVVLTIDEVRARPFFAKTAPLPTHGHVSYQDLVVDARNRYATPRAAVDRAAREQKGEQSDSPAPKRRGPGGFQDAFRSIMASRTKNSPLNKDKEKPDAGEKKQETGGAGKGTERGTKDTKRDAPEKKAEIPEDVLKRLLYVPPVLT